MDGVYTGDLDAASGLPHGRGRMEWENGISFDGEWKGGLFDGFGKKAYSKGGGYEGMWRAGKREGWGTSYYDGKFGYDRWEGEWGERFEYGEMLVISMKFHDIQLKFTDL